MKDKYEGLYNRGTAKKPRWWFRMRWPGMKSPRREFLSTDKEIARIKFEKIKRDKDDLEKYGVQKWEVFKEQYKNEHSALKAKTLEIDLWSLEKFQEEIAPQFLSEMEPHNLLKAQSAWLRKHKDLSLNTLDTWKNRIITISHWAEDLGLTPVHNWRIVKNLSKIRRKQDTYTDDQYQAIQSAYPKFSKEYTAIMFASEAGLRRAEVFYAWLDDIDLDTRIGEVKARDGWSPKMEGDDRRKHYIVSPRLRDYIRELVAHRAKFGNSSKYVYCDPETGYRPTYGEGTITRTLVRLSGRLGFRISLHKCRHTFVTRLMDRGEELASVRNAARHKSSATTEIYDHTGAKKALMAMNTDIFPGASEHKNEHKEIGEAHSPNEK